VGLEGAVGDIAASGDIFERTIYRGVVLGSFDVLSMLIGFLSE